ncbi:transposase [Streptomyces sp. NPDC088560]|uniref:IS110 family transposase n=1 Tax=Streptomyces sp. NPDC088560 TaxID=3365868 RepID=UPI0037F6BFE6
MDIFGRTSTQLLFLLVAHGQQVVYVPRRTVNRTSDAYCGEGKTDAKDVLINGDSARMSSDFTALGIQNECRPFSGC